MRRWVWVCVTSTEACAVRASVEMQTISFTALPTPPQFCNVFFILTSSSDSRWFDCGYTWKQFCHCMQSGLLPLSLRTIRCLWIVDSGTTTWLWLWGVSYHCSALLKILYCDPTKVIMSDSWKMWRDLYKPAYQTCGWVKRVGVHHVRWLWMWLVWMYSDFNLACVNVTYPDLNHFYLNRFNLFSLHQQIENVMSRTVRPTIFYAYFINLYDLVMHADGHGTKSLQEGFLLFRFACHSSVHCSYTCKTW